MAKDKGKKDKAAKETEAAATDTKADKAKTPEFKFGVSDLAEKLGIEPASVRVQLRNRKIEKAGKSYGWNSKKDLDEVAAQLKADKPKGEGKAKKEKAAKGDAGAADAAAEDTGGKKGKKDKKNKKSKKD